MTKEKILRNIDFKELSKSCKDEKDLSNLTKEFMKNMIEKMLESEIEEFQEKSGKKYPIVINSWKNNWDELSTYFQYSEPVRRIIYTTNTIEGFNRQIRKITKTKGGFNSDESLTRLVYLVYKDISKKWQKFISNWAEIISQFAIIFDERLEKYL
jgi:transposase-like protein